MSQPYLEVTYRKGKPLAAYYSLSRRPGQKSHSSRSVGAGLVVDFARDGHAIGIEITSPSVVTLAALNRVLKSLGFQPLTRAEFQPLRAASCVEDWPALARHSGRSGAVPRTMTSVLLRRCAG